MIEPRVMGAVVLEVDDEGKVTATSVDINIELKEIQVRKSFFVDFFKTSIYEISDGTHASNIARLLYYLSIYVYVINHRKVQLSNVRLHHEC